MENNKYFKECKTLKELREQNELLKQAQICRVCKDRKVNKLILPCAHLVTCDLCMPAINKCPKCKGSIKGIVSIYR